METLKKILLNNWHFMRWVRLAFGLFILMQAWQSHSTWMGLIAGFLLFQAFTNTGCCGSAGCALAPGNKELPETKAVEFEEISSPDNNQKNINATA